MRSASDQDTFSFARTANKKVNECIDAGATEAQKKAGTPETKGNGNSPGGNGDYDFHFQMAAGTIQGSVEVGTGRQHFATLRPEAPNTFKGIPYYQRTGLKQSTTIWIYMVKPTIASCTWSYISSCLPTLKRE
jgi:hypothetical protein